MPDINNDDSRKQSRVEVNLSDLPTGPGLRIRILDYNPNICDEVRRAYLLKGSCQPRSHDFPYSAFGQRSRRFNPSWFDDFSTWLEYSVSKDAAYCLCCYLFKPSIGDQGGGDTFVGLGFTNWAKREKLTIHVGGVHSAHNQAWGKCKALLNKKQHIESLVIKHSDQARRDYKLRLIASIDCIRFLLRQEVILNNAPDNLKLTSPDIQKDIVNVVAKETMELIVRDLGDDFFAVLVDESHDVSIKEQMSVVLRYVDKKGCIIERFLSIEHVPNTTSTSLKETLDKLFSRHGLSISKLRGQGYDGASNMQGDIASNVVNVVGGSCKRRDLLQEQQVVKVFEALNSGEISSGRGLNQETSLTRAGDTRWGSHYGTLVSLIALFSSVIDVLQMIGEDGLTHEQKSEARLLSNSSHSFEFVFCLHFMKMILGITNELSQALQKKEQDIVNAMKLVGVCKQRLQKLRVENDGWDSLLNQVNLVCHKHDIDFCNMDEMFILPGRSRRKAPQMTNLHYYRIELFYTVIDLQLMELENRFSETSTELLISMACLNPSNSFSAFDKSKLIRLARFYPDEFSEMELLILDDQLETYIVDMRTEDDFSNLKGISDLAQKMVETKRDKVFTLVYLLIKLAMILPVATATVERTFSAMNIVKNRLRNRMGDQWMNDCLVAYIEKDLFTEIDNEDIVDKFQKMKTRRGSGFIESSLDMISLNTEVNCNQPLPLNTEIEKDNIGIHETTETCLIEDIDANGYLVNNEDSETEYENQTQGDVNFDFDENEFDGETFVGKEFEKLEEVYMFYNRYALLHGFGIRNHLVHKNRITNEPYRKIYVCNKQGFKRVKVDCSGVDTKKRRRDSRTGCEAELKFQKRKMGNGSLTNLVIYTIMV
ncbi:hypothetical protein OSB04_000515 [Centaurea solstitialis]|uniref:TTF-type domain-containing protein n=1 Tax=Centaurea solstitialis TaxID=347529 RepID=A0AA38TR03_9ASTR|nr:hypothetical protein OSB04_000515 [Centaurea solstitialis]